MEKKKSKLLLTHGWVCFLSEGIQNELHSHYSLSLLHSFGADLRVETESGNVYLGKSLYLPPQFPHKLHSQANTLAILVDPDFQESLGLQKSFSEPSPLDSLAFPDWEEANQLVTGKIPRDPWFSQLVSRLVGSSPNTADLQKRDSRISECIRYLENLEEIPGDLSLSVLAERFSLSAERFRHLFSEQIGLGLRKFILYIRLRRVILYRKQGHSLTDAAHMAGFSDSSHFSKTFKQNFGMSPSAVLENSEISLWL